MRNGLALKPGMISGIACTVLMMVAACSGDSIGGTDTTGVVRPPFLAGKIVFSTPTADGTRSDIAAIDTAGGTMIRLTSDTALDQCPQVSPDAARIAFLRSGALWEMNGDGSGLTKIPVAAEIGNRIGCPVWSADSRSIAFSVYIQPETVKTPVPSSLMIAEAATGVVRRVLQDYNIGVFEWSVDNRRIAFTTNLNGGNGYFDLKWNLVDPDGGNRVQVPEDYWSLSLSPQVDRIARDCWLSSTITGICVSDSDGSNLKLIARDVVAPLWSRDGALIAYVNANTIGVVTPDGASIRPVSGIFAGDFAWIGKTHRLVFGCRRVGNNSQYVADVCITDADAPGPPRMLGIVGVSFSTSR